MIGDAPMDYISAQNAGINNTILVATGQLTCEELKKTSNLVLESLKDIECLKI
jgi:phosphoglycolate phosphatase-like HAD superfamily hydrolase